MNNFSAGPSMPIRNARNDWNAAILVLEQALPESVRIGGSRGQRDLIEHTLLAAYLKAGRHEAARNLIAGGPTDGRPSRSRATRGRERKNGDGETSLPRKAAWTPC